MKVNNRILGCVVFVLVLCFADWSLCGMADSSGNDWDSIWLLPMPEPKTVQVGKLGELGKELENRKWLMVATKYHQIHFQNSADKKKVAEIYALIDNLYRFLAERSPAKPQTPIRVFLVPDEYARSRCDKIINSMRTGEEGEVFFMLASLLHEETHIFNFAFLDNVPQSWWSGEFSCIYFQYRALWHGQGKEVKREIKARLPDGPNCHFSEISSSAKKAFDEAISVFYFLEEQYGREKMIELRKALLEDSLKTNGMSLSNSVFEKVFGKEIRLLEAEWLQFYGWKSSTEPKKDEVKDARLEKRISYSVDKQSVQNVVMEMAKRADLGYDWTKSQSNAGEICKDWVNNVRVENKPLDEALKEILEPVGLTYKLEENKIVLYKK